MIRPIAPADRTEWLRMLAGLRPGEPSLSADVERFFAGTDPMLKCVLVEDRGDGRLGGFIEISERTYAEGCATSPVAFIEGWYVDADLRKTGVGKALVRAAEEWARKAGHTEMGSDLVLGNEISLKAHLALGYQEVERLVAMAKRL